MLETIAGLFATPAGTWFHFSLPFQFVVMQITTALASERLVASFDGANFHRNLRRPED